MIDLYSLAFGPNGSFYISYIRNNLNVKYVDDCRQFEATVYSEDPSD